MVRVTGLHSRRIGANEMTHTTSDRGRVYSAWYPERSTAAVAEEPEATERQVSYLDSLLSQRAVDEGLAEAIAEVRASGALTKTAASRYIDTLTRLPRKAAPQTTEAGHPSQVVPAGFYAIDGDDATPVRFYRIDKPTQGKWAGYTFVKQVTGHVGEMGVRVGMPRTVLDAIVAAGVETAAARYGQQIGRCCVCNRVLTNDVSRAAGIGPECAGRGR